MTIMIRRDQTAMRARVPITYRYTPLEGMTIDELIIIIGNTDSVFNEEFQYQIDEANPLWEKAKRHFTVV
jgi:hypothetical protein